MRMYSSGKMCSAVGLFHPCIRKVQMSKYINNTIGQLITDSVSIRKSREQSHGIQLPRHNLYIHLRSANIFLCPRPSLSHLIIVHDSLGSGARSTESPTSPSSENARPASREPSCVEQDRVASFAAWSVRPGPFLLQTWTADISHYHISRPSASRACPRST
jgi:hypothetical protein